jgi:hypothetical protein
VRVFWSWQSDRDQRLHHYFVRDALKLVCKSLAGDPDFAEAERPDVDHDMKGAVGTQDIASTILKKIAGANVFVADMTPVGTTDPKALGAPEGARAKFLQNPNVMSELGYAEHAIGLDRILLVANAAHYPGPEALPFDWRHRSGAKTYNLANGATKPEIDAELKSFVSTLTPIVRAMLLAQQPPPRAPAPLVWKSQSPADLAIWDGQEISYRNPTLGGERRTLTLAPGPRVFARVVPTEWSPPDRTGLAVGISEIGLSLRAREGDWGVNGAGALSVWGLDGATTFNATQWFQDSGELWGVTSAAFNQNAGLVSFAYGSAFPELDRFLGRAVTGIKRVGGAGPFAIRIGACGLQDTVWPTPTGWSVSDALTPFVKVEATAETGDPREWRQALRSFWDEMLDAYGLRRSDSMATFEKDANLPRLNQPN